MRLAGRQNYFPGGWLALAGILLLAALLPLVSLPTLIGPGVTPFLICFTAAGLAYLLALKRLQFETPPTYLILGFALLFRLVMLLTPVTLSDDVYRYVWDGHLMGAGQNPYAEPINSPLLDAYHTPLRGRVNYAWMATPYLPAAQVYFAFVNGLAPQNPFAFQVGALALDLAAGWLVLRLLPRLAIPEKAALVYLWNPLVVMEFAHGAHIDALMVFFVAAALWGLVERSRGGLLLSALALAAGVLVKGWPVLIAPLFVRRWGLGRTILFGLGVVLPLAAFASEAGWGLSGAADGRGVFGAVRIYSAEFKFNSGLYTWFARLLSPAAARLLAVAAPGLLGLVLGWHVWRLKGGRCDDPTGTDRTLLRWAALPFGMYLLLAPTVHPWYLTLLLALLPFFWPALGEGPAVRRWIWPWVYFMFFNAFTYLAYSGISAPDGLDLIRTAFYLPLWGLLVWAGWSNRPSPGT
jgi:hypothetical protein